ncbi:MAG TPA: hypothetical protein PLS93_14970 [Accumulibacter sp.]|nr:hypothetical protein [Accumulibacter sp.]
MFLAKGAILGKQGFSCVKLTGKRTGQALRRPSFAAAKKQA